MVDLAPAGIPSQLLLVTMALVPELPHFQSSPPLAQTAASGSRSPLPFQALAWARSSATQGGCLLDRMIRLGTGDRPELVISDRLVARYQKTRLHRRDEKQNAERTRGLATRVPVSPDTKRGDKLMILRELLVGTMAPGINQRLVARRGILLSCTKRLAYMIMSRGMRMFYDG